MIEDWNRPRNESFKSKLEVWHRSRERILIRVRQFIIERKKQEALEREQLRRERPSANPQRVSLLPDDNSNPHYGGRKP